MWYIESFELITKGISHFADILFITYYHQAVTHLDDHVRRSQQVYSGTVDTRNGSVVLLTEIERTNPFAVTFRPRHCNPSGNQVVRFLGLHMQVIILHFSKQTQRVEILLLCQDTQCVTILECSLLID